MSPVSTEDISPVSTEDGACPDTVGMGCSQKNLPPWKRGVAVTKPERSYLANPHMLTSGCMGPVRSHWGSSGTGLGHYLSRTPIRVHRVIRQGSSGRIGSRRDISATSAKVRSGPKTSNLLRNGSRIDGLARNKDQMNPAACPDPSGPLLRPKTAKKHFFLTVFGLRSGLDGSGQAIRFIWS